MARFPISNSFYIKGLLLLTLLVLNFSYLYAKIEKYHFARKGMIDLSMDSLHTKSIINLKGEWEFYWKKLYGPNRFAHKKPAKITDYHSIPGKWTEKKIKGKLLPYKGFATYRLIIINPTKKQKKTLQALQIGHALMANRFLSFRLWFNGKLIAWRGVMRSVKNTKGSKQTLNLDKRIYPIKSLKQWNEIIIHISNELYNQGGFLDTLLLGEHDKLIKKNKFWERINYFAVAALVFMALYNIIIFILHRKEKTPLVFGLFCVLGALYTIQLFPSMYFSEIIIGLHDMYTIHIITVCLLVALCMVLIKSLFPENIPIIVVHATTGVSMLVMFILLLSDFATARIIFQFFFMLIGGLILYIIYALTKALFEKKEGASIFLIGFYLFFVLALNDMLYDVRLVRTIVLLPFGLLSICLSMAILMSQKFSKAALSVESLSVALENREKFIAEQAISTISIKEKGNDHFFHCNDIIYISIQSKKVILHCKDDDRELHLMYKEIEENLPESQFVRIHKQYVINISFLQKLSHIVSGRYKVLLTDEDDTELPVGRTYLEDLRNMLEKNKNI